jgi:hypothetical protein
MRDLFYVASYPGRFMGNSMVSRHDFLAAAQFLEIGELNEPHCTTLQVY